MRASGKVRCEVGAGQLGPWLLALVMLVGCGRTYQDCEGCGALAGEVGGAAGSAVGGESGGLGAMPSFGGGGQPSAGAPSHDACNIGALDAPLVRYSNTDLEWTMDDILGPGPGLAREGTERSDQGVVRMAHPLFVRSLLESVEARVAAAEFDDSGWVDCDADVEERSGCVDTWIRQRGLRIYRRPLTEEQVAGYVAQFRELAGASPLSAARAVLTTMLLSPYFVFRIELGERRTTVLGAPPREPPSLPNPMLPAGTPLTAFEIAARLSHFIQRSAPDAALLDHAASGDLQNPAALRAEAERLLLTPQGGRARVLQHLEWLGLDEFGVEVLDAAPLPHMKEQTTAFIADVLEHRDGSFTALLASSRYPLNHTLAEHYGIEASVGADLEWVDLDPNLYAGVLGQGAWLMSRPRPTYRGLELRRRLLCSEVPPPPEGLMDGLVGNTPRERILNATSVSPACKGCHQMMDPIGFALEAFDDQGRLTGFDTSGELLLPDSGEVLPLTGPQDLGRAVAQSHQAHLCAAQRYVEHLLQRQTQDPLERLMFECLVRPFPRGELDLNYLAREVAASDAMRLTRRSVALAVGVGTALDPLEHAIEETAGLLSAFSDTERAALEIYQSALRDVQAQR